MCRLRPTCCGFGRSPNSIAFNHDNDYTRGTTTTADDDGNCAPNAANDYRIKLFVVVVVVVDNGVA